MREYACVPPAMLDDGPALEAWLAKALAYARALAAQAEEAARRHEAVPASRPWLYLPLLLASADIGTSPPRSPITLTSWVSPGTTTLLFC